MNGPSRPRALDDYHKALLGKVVEFLASTDLEKIVVEFNGYGDQGQIEDPRLYGPDEAVRVKPETFDWLRSSLHEVIDATVDSTYGDWQSNIGGSGDFEVSRFGARLDFGWREEVVEPEEPLHFGPDGGVIELPAGSRDPASVYVRRKEMLRTVTDRNLGAVVRHMSAVGLTKVEVEFDGYEGQRMVERIETTPALDREPEKVHELQVVRFDAGLKDYVYADLGVVSFQRAMENVAYELLHRDEPGWDGPHGASGRVSIGMRGYAIDIGDRRLGRDFDRRAPDPAPVDDMAPGP